MIAPIRLSGLQIDARLPTPHPTADGLLEGPTPDFCD